MNTEHSPVPPSQNGGKKKAEAWEFSAIPWTFPLDQAQTIEGWEPFAVAVIRVPIPATAEFNEGVGDTTCLIVRRPA